MATTDQTMMKVQRLLTQTMGLGIKLSGERIVITMEGASTAAFIRIQDWGETDDGEPQSLVLITAPLLSGVKPTPELFEWVAREGGSKWFGHVEVYNDKKTPGTVNLRMSHTLLGDYLDEMELREALGAVLHVADEWDDELQGRFGGERLIEG